jgi:transposase
LEVTLSKHIQIAPHLSEEKLTEYYRKCTHPKEKIHFQVIILRLKGRTTKEVAQICGYNEAWIRHLVRRYNQYGPQGLQDGHRRNGKKKMLSPSQLEDLYQAVLNERPPGGGLWTGPKVSEWMSKVLGRKVYPQRAWEYLRNLGFTKQTPRPRNPKASIQDQEAFKKNSVVD